MLTQTLQSMFESLNHPQQKHAAIVHMPVALSALGLLVLLAWAVTRGQSCSLRRCCVAIYLLAAITAWMGHESGQEAMARLDTATMTQPALELLEKHEQMGDWAWRYFLLMTVVMALTAIKAQHVLWRTAVVAVAVLAGLGMATYTAVTAHHGGALVYRHGVGVPTSANNMAWEQLPDMKGDHGDPATVTPKPPTDQTTPIP